jgi:hypothetical protein
VPCGATLPACYTGRDRCFTPKSSTVPRNRTAGPHVMPITCPMWGPCSSHFRVTRGHYFPFHTRKVALVADALGASSKLIMSACEAPEGTGESDTAQVVGSSAWLAAEVAALEAAGVPAGREPPQGRQVRQIPALAS